MPVAALCVCMAGCIDTGQNRTLVPLFVGGTDRSEPIAGAFGATVVLDQADLAFGPLVLCAGATAGQLCETGRLEWLESAVIDTLAGAPDSIGELEGVTGPVQSYMYDIGISSQLTRSDPFVLDAAEALGDVSFVVAGRATVSGTEIPFQASVPIQQTNDTELGVPVIRKSSSEEFFRDVGQNEAGLWIRFDPAPWVESIDFRPYLDQASVAGGAVIEPGSEAFRSLQISLTSAGRPEFRWSAP